jgi:hypothetical protein
MLLVIPEVDPPTDSNRSNLGMADLEVAERTISVGCSFQRYTPMPCYPIDRHSFRKHIYCSVKLRVILLYVPYATMPPA